MNKYILMILLLIGLNPFIKADFEPILPPEPTVLRSLILNTEPQGVVSCSGAGFYTIDKTIPIATSRE